jgi:hypothetical protein
MTHHPADGGRRQPPNRKTRQVPPSKDHTTIQNDPANWPPPNGTLAISSPPMRSDPANRAPAERNPRNQQLPNAE